MTYPRGGIEMTDEPKILCEVMVTTLVREGGQFNKGDLLQLTESEVQQLGTSIRALPEPGLNEDIEKQLKKEVAVTLTLKATIARLEEEISDMKGQIATRDEEIQKLTAEYADLKRRHENLFKRRELEAVKSFSKKMEIDD